MDALARPDAAARAARRTSRRSSCATAAGGRGPDVFVIVDDYDLVSTSSGNPLAALTENLPFARDVGVRFIIARSSAGASRSMYEPFMQRIKELGAVGDAAFKLYNDFGKYSDHARISSMAAAGGLKTEGFAIGGALDHVAEHWVDQCRNLQDACAHISNHLDYTKNAHAATRSTSPGP